MAGLHRLCESVEMELTKIADKPLNSSSLDNAYKLIDIMKDIKTIEAMEGEYSYNSNESYGRHYVKGHYSRDNDEGMNSYSRYMDHKNSYRYSQSQASHDKMMNSLSDYMREVTARLEDMLRDSDSQEERNMIQRYISNIRSL